MTSDEAWYPYDTGRAEECSDKKNDNGWVLRYLLEEPGVLKETRRRQNYFQSSSMVDSSQTAGGIEEVLPAEYLSTRTYCETPGSGRKNKQLNIIAPTEML